MTTAHPGRRPRKTRTRPLLRRRRTTRRRSLPRTHPGWYVTAVIALLAAANTWPYLVGAAVALLAVVVVLNAVRPARLPRLAPLFSRVDRLATWRRARPSLPRQRTAAAFHRLTPGRFEQAIADLAEEDPHTVRATVVGGTGDGGIDVRVKRADGTHVFIQCKRYKQGKNVGARDIRDANGAYRALHHCHRAVIVTTAGFTRDALDTNARLHATGQGIRLVNGADLEAWAAGGPSPLDP